MKNSNTISSKRLVESTRPNATRGTQALLGLIGFYQRLRAGRVSPCRFYPSCSDYAAEAIAAHGSIRGTWLAFRRVLRCRPFGPHGIDLVPEPNEVRSSRSCTR
jgi:putative membrane protein insertion efficiency factor